MVGVFRIMIWLIILIWTISFLLSPWGGRPDGKAPWERQPPRVFAGAARHWRRPTISRRILSSFKKTVLKQEKKKKWLDLWEISSQTAVSAWDLAIICHLKELENFKYVFWSGLGTHPAGQRVSRGGSTLRGSHGLLQGSLAGPSGHRQRDAEAAR